MIDWQRRIQLEQAIRARSDLTMAAKVIAGVLLDHLNLKTAQCNPSRERIMSCSAAGRTTVADALMLLQEKNIVSCASGGGTKSNSYSFPDLESTVSPSSEGAEIRPGPKSDPVRISDERGPRSGPEGAEIRPAPGRNPAPNKELNKELNKEKNTPPQPPEGQCEVWAGFYDVLVQSFRSAGYSKMPSMKGPLELWKVQGYRPEICLAVIRDTIRRNKTIKTLAWFEKPMAKAHEGLREEAGANVRIYEKTDEATEWMRFDNAHGRPFNFVMTDPSRGGLKYNLRPTQWPPKAATIERRPDRGVASALTGIKAYHESKVG